MPFCIRYCLQLPLLLCIIICPRRTGAITENGAYLDGDLLAIASERGIGAAPISGSYEKSTGYIIPPISATKISRVHNECACQYLCKNTLTCRDFSFHRIREQGVCHLGERPRTPFSRPHNSGVLFLHPEDDGSFIGYDGYTYWAVNEQLTLEDARTVCQYKDGYDLGIYQTLLQLRTLNDFKLRSGFSEVWVDMHIGTTINGTWTGIWGNGIPYLDTQVGYHYPEILIIHSGRYAFRSDSLNRFNDRPPTYYFNFLCQKIPQNIFYETNINTIMIPSKL